MSSQLKEPNMVKNNSNISDKVKKSEEKIDQNYTKKLISTLLLSLCFLIAIQAGPIVCSFLVFIIVIFIFQELISLSKYQDRNRELKNYYLNSFYIFTVFIYFFYVIMIQHKINSDNYTSGSIKVSFPYYIFSYFVL